MKISENFIKIEGVSGLYNWGNCKYQLKHTYKNENASECITSKWTKEELEAHLSKYKKVGK